MISPPPPRGTTARVCTALIGVALVTTGVLLVVRPLTSVIVLLVLLAVGLIGIAVRVVAGRPRRPVRIVAALVLVVLAVGIVAGLPRAAVALPVALALALVANAVRLLVAAVRRRGRTRWTGALWAAAGLIAAVLCGVWPDVATIAAGAATAIGIAVAGVRTVWTAIRGATPDGAPRRPHRRGRAALGIIAASVALLVSGGAAAGSLALTADTARVDDFYHWDEPIPDEPGAVLRTAPYDGEVPSGAVADRILYVTTRSDGSVALASAVVAYPSAAAVAPRPVLAWQHGTTGVARSCGPSVGTDALTEEAVPGIGRAIARGWAVVATDYPGQGTAGRYPYLVGEGEGRATLDAVRAVNRIDAVGASTRTWLWGHSQGGHASLWAGQIAEEYAPELTVAGVAALSAAADPLTLAQRVTGGGGSALSAVVTSLVLVPYAAEYPDVTLDATVHPAGHGIVRAFASRCVIETPTLVSVLVGTALRLDAPLYRLDLDTGPTHDRLAQNVADGIVPAPLFLGQGIDDEVVPIATQRALAASLCAEDRAVEAHEYPGRSHMGVIEPGSPLLDDLDAWVDAVESGAEPDTCS
ncbi:lipase family protein [Mycetocola reblochoni]|uniref:Lysophospholipase n=2 Tax=Mycetocola reblochoni TaxID=331618 RepID=A0A1R4IMR3_9MICO|nr:lipase family protein [Mycetocola reblochoni]RLP67920.1 lipase [Mycetocola reblochoni]SJN21137.1 hypothetical protein FM119_02605 [Mycetocola reblochoni REB411]